MRTKIRLTIYAIHILFFIINIYIFKRYSLSFDSYLDLFGEDETYWLEASQCEWNSTFDLCYMLFLNFYPYLIYLFQDYGLSLINFLLFKCILYSVSVWMLIQCLYYYKYQNLLIFEAFLLINPYVLLIHTSLLRDDIIVSLILLISTYLYKIQNDVKRNVKLDFCILISLSIIMMGFRFGYGVISMMVILLTYLIKNRTVGLKVKIFISFSSIYIIINYLKNYIMEYDVNLILINLRRLLFSPLPHNVLSGTIKDLGTDTSLLPVYSLIFPIFSIYILIRLLIDFIYNKNLVKKIFRRNYSVLILSIGLLLPYSISTLDVAGPRQSLPSTVLLFYILGVRYIYLKISR